MKISKSLKVTNGQQLSLIYHYLHLHVGTHCGRGWKAQQYGNAVLLCGAIASDAMYGA